MSFRFDIFAIVLILWLANPVQAEDKVAAPLPEREKFQLYLLMGQSNMAGANTPEEEDKKPHPRVMMFTAEEQWKVAADPVHRRNQGGVGPGHSFGKNMAESQPQISFGLIPCAVGGTPLSRWERGGDLYSNAVRRARLAMKNGTLAGILWHQGEADSKTSETAYSYGDRLAKMIGNIRDDLNSPNLPFVVGQIGHFTYTHRENRFPFAKTVNSAIAGIPSRVPFTACVLATNLAHTGDEVHFTAAAQREMGRRYAEEMLQLQTVLYPLASRSNTVDYPRVDVAPWYEVDPNWPQRPADISWGHVPGVVVDHADNVWIYTRTNPTVQVYAADGRYLFGWENKNTNAIAHGIKIDRDGNIWLVDAGLHIARKHSPDGNVLLTLGTEGVHGEDGSHFNKPTDIAFASNGDIFVADGYNNSRIAHFDKSGKFIKSWGTMGTEPGRFSIPHAIAIDSRDRIYVADRNNVRVQVFDTSGKLLDVWRDIIVPWGFCITPSDEIWVCGSSPMPWRFDPKYAAAPLGCPPKDQVFMKFNTDGKLLQLWTAPKAEDGNEKPGELNWLHAVALDSKGNIFAGDIIGQRVQKFIRRN